MITPRRFRVMDGLGNRCRQRLRWTAADRGAQAFSIELACGDEKALTTRCGLRIIGRQIDVSCSFAPADQNAVMRHRQQDQLGVSGCRE